MSKLKVVVVANCQARPLATALIALSSVIEVTSIIIVHLATNKDYEAYKAAFDDADFIVAQLVQDNYPCSFVTTNFLRANYGGKVVSIVNLFFSGYNPDWQYLRHEDRSPLKGPMRDYHNKTIFYSWRKHESMDECFSKLNSLEFNNHYSLVAKSSLNELMSRERLADVKICSFIEENMFEHRLFFIFNHPSQFLITEYARRIIGFLNIGDLNAVGSDLKEGLDQVIPVANICSPLARIEELNKGVELIINDNQVVNSVKTVYYTNEELIVSFYNLYDNIKVARGLW